MATRPNGTGYQPRNTPAERRAFYDLIRRLRTEGGGGTGLPPGGTTSQVLAKASDADGDTAWVPPAPKGDTGATGPEGPMGPQGPQGTQGPTGATGPEGPQGDTGAQGIQGIQGPPGVQGPKGDPGDTGATGPQGDVGPVGPAGPEGPQGVDGPAGPPGADSTVPGPQGPQGATGAQGPVGEQGPQGLPGVDGADGPQGPAGPTGPTGATGPQGATGSTGPAGPGVPVGGTAGQVLAKTSATDYATGWSTPFTQAAADALYVNVNGDTMTSFLTLANADPTAANHAARKSYVDATVATAEAKERSKGGQLVVNGSGIMLNNTNFANSTFVPSDHPVGTSGSFLAGTAANASVNPEEFIPVDVNKWYFMGAWARETVAGLTGANAYLGVQPFDNANLGIGPQMIGWRANTTTTLAVQLDPGATTITLTSAANWNNAAGANTHFRGMIAWNYVDPSGYAWPVETYSRNVWLNIYDDGAIVGNTITLRVPWAGPMIPAGTPVSNSTSGGTYMYFAWTGAVTPTPETWTYHDSLNAPLGGGVHVGPATFSNKFPQGTAKCKLVLLSNRVAGSRTAWAGIWMSEVVNTMQQAWPVGSVYTSVLSTPPPFPGTWVALDPGPAIAVNAPATMALYYWQRTA